MLFILQMHHRIFYDRKEVNLKGRGNIFYRQIKKQSQFEQSPNTQIHLFILINMSLVHKGPSLHTVLSIIHCIHSSTVILNHLPRLIESGFPTVVFPFSEVPSLQHGQQKLQSQKPVGFGVLGPGKCLS